MVDIIDDVYPISVTKILIEGNLDIINATAPSEAEPGTLFNIVVNITNWGGDDSCFANLVDDDLQMTIMTMTFNVPGYTSFTITFPGIQMQNRDMNYMIEAGHVV